MSKRPSIPAEIKREVRQRCGFGCVICGCPIYEYDHVVEWSKTRHHKADELTLLCSKHHSEKTKKLLPREKVIAANDQPYNLVNGKSSAQTLYYSGNDFKMELGGSVSTFKGLKDGQTFSPFAIDGQPVVSFTIDGGDVLLNIKITNEAGEDLFRVNKSELIYSVGMWDIEWVGQTLTMREGFREILLEIEFDPPNKVSINRGSLHFNGIELEIGRDYIFCLNNVSLIMNCTVNGLGYGFALGSPVPDGPSGMVMSGFPRPVADRDAAKQVLRTKLKEMRKERAIRTINKYQLWER